MKIEHLYYFLVIADAKSINKASQKLFVSQQHLSRIISNLENDLNAQLFLRTSTGITLTEKGAKLKQYAQKIVDSYREMQAYFYLDSLPIQNQDKQIEGECQIVLPFFFSLFLTDFMKRFNDVFPHINLRCFEGRTAYTAEEIHNSEQLYLFIDTPFQIDTLLNAAPELKSYYIGDTEVAVCVNRSSPLANKTSITCDDFISSLQTGYPQSEWNKYLSPNQLLFISSNIYQHLDSVLQNNSVCIVPSYTRAGIYASYPDIVLLPFKKMVLNPIYIFHSSSHTLTDAEKATIYFISDYMKKIEQPEKIELLLTKKLTH